MLAPSPLARAYKRKVVPQVNSHNVFDARE
jgi:hypothetical protein